LANRARHYANTYDPVITENTLVMTHKSSLLQLAVKITITHVIEMDVGARCRLDEPGRAE